jgi:Helicase conserved C-terminal domain/SNF2-related domain/PLD-like domain
MTAFEGLPTFATNKPNEGISVADEVNRLFRVLRTKFQEIPAINIATAYVNPGGFMLLADELEKAPRVRLLLGAEPIEERVSAAAKGVKVRKADFDSIAASHDAWLRAERDLTGFTAETIADAKRMVDWLRSVDPTGLAKVEVRRYTKGFLHGKAYVSADKDMPGVLAGSSNMTYAGLKLNAELNLGYPAGDPVNAANVVNWFEEFWADSEDYDLASIYEAQWQAHSPNLIFTRMLHELYGGSLEDERNKVSMFDLAQFQLDGISRMQRLLAENGGVLVADEVGLGKTFLAGEVIHEATAIRRQRVLIICPASLKESMWEPFLEKHGFNRLAKVLSFDAVRTRMDKENPGHADFLNEVSDYAMIVVDEAHNLRNASADRSKALDRVILEGAYPKQVVLLTATPVNNSLQDLETLVRYFIRDDAQFAGDGIPSIRQYIKTAQDMDPENLTPDHLFDLMDRVAVRRTRKFVKDHYSNDRIKAPDGSMQLVKFPTPRVREIKYQHDALGLELIDKVLDALAIYEDEDLYSAYTKAKADPNRLMMARYTPSRYLMVENGVERFQIQNAGLLRSGLLKRLESSPKALANTLGTLKKSHEQFLSALKGGLVLEGEALREWTSADADNLDDFIEDLDEAGAKGVHSASDYYIEALEADAESDLALIESLQLLALKVSNSTDPKFEALVSELEAIVLASQKFSPVAASEGDRRKVIVFSSYSDTVLDVYDRLQNRLSEKRAEPISVYFDRVAEPQFGAYRKTHDAGRAGGVDQGGRANVIQGFAPKTAARFSDSGAVVTADLFDILITTDVLAEGVNLQQAGQVINYDLPWNPMRIVQRHGRVDRLFSEHEEVHMGLFFPSDRLDEMLGLQARLEAKLARAEAAVGAANVLPGRNVSREVILNDKERIAEEFERLLEARGGDGALSGEEFRRRLFSQLANYPGKQAEVEGLPYGSGSGFRSQVMKTNSYVFCLKMADHGEPWLRHVAVDENWSLILEEGKPVISDQKLISLRVADPGRGETERFVPDQALANVFNTWEVIKKEAHAAWQYLTDPNNLHADIPAAFRDAHAFVLAHGSYLGAEKQRATLARLEVVPGTRVQKYMRQALNHPGTAEAVVDRIIAVLDGNGLQVPVRPEPLPSISESQVRLICWMAVSAKIEIEAVPGESA